MRNFFYSLIFVFGIVVITSAQNDTTRRSPDGRKAFNEPKQEMNWQDRLFWGGTVGAWFGTQTFIDLSPLVGIKITDKLSVGVGFIYNYYNYSYGGYKYQTSLYGSRLYARYFVWENVFLQAGWDKINRDNPNPYYNASERVWVDNLLVGGGVRYPVSDKLYLVATGLWNLNQSSLSPYANPIIQIGFVGGF